MTPKHPNGNGWAKYEQVQALVEEKMKPVVEDVREIKADVKTLLLSRTAQEAADKARSEATDAYESSRGSLWKKLGIMAAVVSAGIALFHDLIKAALGH